MVFVRWLRAVLSHWQQSVTGTTLSFSGLIAELWQAVNPHVFFSTWSIRPWMLWGGGLLILGWAMFLAWKDQFDRAEAVAGQVSIEPDWYHCRQYVLMKHLQSSLCFRVHNVDDKRHTLLNASGKLFKQTRLGRSTQIADASYIQRRIGKPPKAQSFATTHSWGHSLLFGEPDGKIECLPRDVSDLINVQVDFFEHEGAPSEVTSDHFVLVTLVFLGGIEKDVRMPLVSGHENDEIVYDYKGNAVRKKQRTEADNVLSHLS